MNKQLIGELSQEEIVKLKSENPNGIFAIKTENGKIAYFKRPTWDDLNIAASQLQSDTLLDYTRDLMRECFIGGCNDLIENQDDLIGAGKVFNKQIEGSKAELVKL